MLPQRCCRLFWGLKDTNHPRPLRRRIIISGTSITNTIIEMYSSVVLLADKVHNMWVSENPVELFSGSIKSGVINVCHLLNLWWSWESIMADTFSEGISLLCYVLHFSADCRTGTFLLCIDDVSGNQKWWILQLLPLWFSDILYHVFNYMGRSQAHRP